MSDMRGRTPFYDHLLLEVKGDDSHVQSVLIGLTWTLVKTISGWGLAMSPAEKTRTLSWSGTLKGKSIAEISQWLYSWNPFESTIALATINSVLNNNRQLLYKALPITGTMAGNLRVFEYFLPRLKNKRVVVIGRYPGIENIASHCDLQILERSPQAGDLPDVACEYVLESADWVFISGATIANKTFPRLAELSRNAITVLIGPSVPWLNALSAFDIDYVAGVRVVQEEDLLTTVMEGGGTRIFDSAVNYCLADLTEQQLTKTKNNIAGVVQQRVLLKEDMARWLELNKTRYPRLEELAMLDERLSQLDIRFKRLWDNNKC